MMYTATWGSIHVQHVTTISYDVCDRPLTPGELKALAANPGLFEDANAPILTDNLSTVDEGSPNASDPDPPEVETVAHANDHIGTADPPNVSWETEGLTPGALYEYMRKNAECKCGTCPVCIENTTHHEKSNARIRVWDHDVNANQEQLDLGNLETFVDLGRDLHDDSISEDAAEPWMDRDEFNIRKGKCFHLAGYRLADRKGRQIDDIRVGRYQPYLIRSLSHGRIWLRPDVTVIDYLRSALRWGVAGSVETIWLKDDDHSWEIDADMRYGDGRCTVWPPSPMPAYSEAWIYEKNCDDIMRRPPEFYVPSFILNCEELV